MALLPNMAKIVIKTTAMSDIEQTAKQALSHHQAGELRKAEQLLASGNALDALIVIEEGKRRGLEGPELDALRRRTAASLRSGPNEAEISELLALFSTNRLAEAETAARQMVQIWPNHGTGWKALGAALATQQRMAEALPILQKAVALLTSDAEAHKNVGIVLMYLGRLSEAETSYRRAVELEPDYSEAHNNLGNVLQAIGQLEEAARCHRRALEIHPDDHVAYNALGNALREMGQLNEAAGCYRCALELKPDYHVAHNNLGNALQGLDQTDEAVRCYRGALDLKPDLHEAHHNLGNVLDQLGRLDEAVGRYQRALELKPELHEVHNKLGGALHRLERLDEAERCYRRVLEFKPDFHEAHSNLGNVLSDLGRRVDAVARYERALAIKPDFAIAYNNLGHALQALDRSTEAEKRYRRALELKPDYHEAYTNLGDTLQALGRLSEAKTSYRRAIELKPDFAIAHGNLGNALRGLGRLLESEASNRRALELKPDYHEAHSNLIFTLDLLEGCSIGEQQAERHRWYAQHGRRYAAAIKPHDNRPDSDRKLRIGYVSADFRRHSAYYGFSPIILRHDRNAFEVACYSGVKLEDDATARLRQAAHLWRSTLGVSDEALAEQIRCDRIDILVDLSGHSGGNRLLVFARKPAPIQVTGWGFAGGTGLATMDYYVCDAVVVPAEERGLYAEEVIYLPCGACYEAPEYAPAVSALPALQGKAFTFGCINRVEKISDRVMVLWGRILAQLPEARLLIKGRGLEDPVQRQRFLRRLRDAGVGAERVRLMGTSFHPEHLRIYHEVDLGLDSYPHGGGISTAEALWMGLPVVTLNGLTISGRITPSILTALEMQDWIAHDDEEYVRIAVQAVRDLPGLARLRAQLRPRLTSSIVGDVQRYTGEVEAAFRSMWRRWCAGAPVAPFDAAAQEETQNIIAQDAGDVGH